MQKMTTSRKSFLIRSGAIASGSGLALLTGCAGASSSLPNSATSGQPLFAKRMSFNVKSTVTKGRAPASVGPSAGTLSVNDTGTQVVGTLGESSFTGSLSMSSGNKIVGVTLNDGFSSHSMSAISPATVAAFGTAQTTVYSDGSTLTRTMADDYNGNGTFKSASGQVWSVSFQMNGSTSSFMYDGPTSGSLDSTLGSPTSTQSGSRQKECDAKGVAMTATAFDAAGLFLGAI